MPNITRSNENGLTIVRMERGKANALDSAMIGELFAALGEAAADATVRGLVLASARPGIFSAGFDVTQVFGLDRLGLCDFFGRFIDPQPHGANDI